MTAALMHIPENSDRVIASHIPRFRPHEQEEFSISIAPTGEVTAYNHTIPEAQFGAQLSLEEAQAIAEDHLVDDRNWQLSDWELINRSSRKLIGLRPILVAGD